MAEGTIRISKILKDFNIGLGTLVEFLKKKGIEVEPNPGAKISADAFALVEKEFSKEQLIKEQSRKVAITVKEITDKVEQHREKADDAELEKEIIIKTNVLADKPKVKKPEPAAKVVEAKTPENVPSDHHDLKVLGKIDLDKPAAPKAPEKVEEKPEEKPQPAVQPAPAPVAEKPASPDYIETKVEKLQGPKISGTIDLSKFEKKPSQNQNKTDQQGGAQDDRNKGKNHKGKRERIHKSGANKVDVNSSNGQNGQGSRRNANSGRGRSKDSFKFVKAELDEEEIQKQIKETYARMTEGKGKTKGAKHRREKRDLFEQKMEEEHRMEMATSNILKVTEFVTVNDLAILMNNTPVTKVIEACMNLGLMVSIN